MAHQFRQLIPLIMAILVLMSPVIYLNRHIFTTAYVYIADQIHPSVPGDVSWLRVRGNQIVDTDNQPVILRGVNISSINWNPRYKPWHPQAVAYAAQNWGVNVIRTRVFEDDFINDPVKFFKDLDEEIILPARQQGVYVILHPWPKDNDSLPTKNTQKMWVSIANRYRQDPTIIYDILGEPRDIGFDELQDATNRLIPAIRKVHKNALIMVTGLDWGRDINQWRQAPLPYENIVYRTNPLQQAGGN
jgi:aryl-phospho-beta-D-glucosidase BglC (GH1 family)